MSYKPGSLLFTMIMLLLFVNLQAQSDFFNTNPITISEVDAIEGKFGSRAVKQKLKVVYKNGGSGLDYRRPAIQDYDAVYVTYNYSQKDSVVVSISYHFPINENREKPNKKNIAAYNAAFDKLVRLLSRDFREPEPNQGKLTQYKETIVADSNSINNERKVKWDFPDYSITATLIWTERNGEVLMVFIEWK